LKFTNFYEGSKCEIFLPKIPNEDVIISSLLSIRKLVVRIRIIYEHNASAKMIFASGFLITDRLVLTCAHNFDFIQWANQKVPYSKIYVCSGDPTYETLFSLTNSNNSWIEA
jgi:hypothetical protein